MAPRRGGGVSVGGGGSGGGGGGDDDWSNPYYYDPGARYSPSDLNALRASIACSVLLLIAALICIGMILKKSWLNRDGRRNKLRLFAFLAALISIVISCAGNIASTTLDIQGPIRDVDYYADIAYSDQFGLHVLPSIVSFFEIVSTALLFGLVLVETTRRNRHVDHKCTTFETLGFITIFALFVIAVAEWVIHMIRIGLVNESFDDPGNLPLTLSLTYQIIAVLLATVMLAATPSKKSTEQITKTHSSRIRSVTRALWLVRALYITGLCVYAYSESARAFTVYVSMASTADIMWIVVILLLALLAWDSHKSHQAGSTYVGIQQPGPTYGNVMPMQHSNQAHGGTVPSQQPSYAYANAVSQQQSWPVYGNAGTTQYQSLNDSYYQKEPNVSTHPQAPLWPAHT